MRINPIIPIWLMAIICVVLILIKRRGFFPFLRQIIMVDVRRCFETENEIIISDMFHPKFWRYALAEFSFCQRFRESDIQHADVSAFQVVCCGYRWVEGVVASL